MDALPKEQPVRETGNIRDRFDEILALIDRLPETVDPNNPLEWDEYGLPK